MRAENKLFLWDIDGTLITVGGAGERALILAIKDTFGIEGNLDGIEYAGRTDRRICYMLHDFYDVEKTEQSMQSFLDSYLIHLENEIKDTKMTVIDGIRGILDLIETNPYLYQGLLTGNLERGSEIKLQHFGLWDYFQFGAFSNLSMNRNKLAGYALGKAAQATGIRFMPENVYVLGDTPLDIECGKCIHAKTVAVATGKFSAEELSKHNPDYVFDTLGDPHDFIEKLLVD